MLDKQYWDIFNIILEQQLLRPRRNRDFPEWLLVESNVKVIAERDRELLNDFRDGIVGIGIAPLLKDKVLFWQVYEWLEPLISRSVWIMIRKLVEPLDQQIGRLLANEVADDFLADIDTFVQTRAGFGIEADSGVERLLWVAREGGVVTGLAGDVNAPTVTAYFPTERYPKVDLEPLYLQLQQETGVYLPDMVGEDRSE